MHVIFLVVRLRWLLVLDGTEACQALIANEGLDGVEIKDTDVHSEIEFETVEKKRSVQISLDYNFFVAECVRQII